MIGCGRWGWEGEEREELALTVYSVASTVLGLLTWISQLYSYTEHKMYHYACLAFGESEAARG